MRVVPPPRIGFTAKAWSISGGQLETFGPWSGLPPDNSPSPVREVATQAMAADSYQPTGVTPSRMGRSMMGLTVSHYRILQKLGEVGMGVVYKAQDLKLDRLVALKFLPHHISPDEEEKERFIREAKAAPALDHPNIGTIHEIAETDDGQMFIAMAHYEGETLKQKIERGPLPVKEAVDIASQIALGLAKAHGWQIVQRPDLDRDRIGYYGFSRGASMGAILPALEKRIR